MSKAPIARDYGPGMIHVRQLNAIAVIGGAHKAFSERENQLVQRTFQVYSISKDKWYFDPKGKRLPLMLKGRRNTSVVA